MALMSVLECALTARRELGLEAAIRYMDRVSMMRGEDAGYYHAVAMLLRRWA
jgi:hypothetical protein